MMYREVCGITSQSGKFQWPLIVSFMFELSDLSLLIGASLCLYTIPLYLNIIKDTQSTCFTLIFTTTRVSSF